jgi:hypothetical protein
MATPFCVAMFLPLAGRMATRRRAAMPLFESRNTRAGPPGDLPARANAGTCGRRRLRVCSRAARISPSPRKVTRVISYEGRNRRTVNFLKTIYFDRPEWTPCSVGLLPATWMRHREALEDLVLAHPRIWPGVKKGATDFDRLSAPLYERGRHTDCWGSVWDNIAPGMDSAPVGHPLEDWSALDRLKVPDPMTDDDFGPRPPWDEVKRQMDAARARGDLAAGGGLSHGFMYMRLYYLRGFQNLMLDMAADDPRLYRLIEIVERYNAAVIRKYVAMGAEIMYFGDDLGHQKSLPMGPVLWRKFIKPSYDRMLRPCRERQVPVYLHTDGHVLEIIPDLIETGVRIVNPQIRANGLAGLRKIARGKVCINQDLDRQLFPFATPRQIEDHIGEVFEGLYLKKGGLMLAAECGPDVPLENVEAICRTFEKLCKLPDVA